MRDKIHYLEIVRAILPSESHVHKKLDQILNLLLVIDGEKTVLDTAREFDYPFGLVLEYLELFLGKGIIKHL